MFKGRIWNPFLLLAGAATILLSACTNSSTTHETTVSLDQPVTLSVVGPWDQPTFEKQFDSFVKKKYPNVILNYSQVSSSSDPKLQQLVAAGTPPDLLMSNGLSNVTGWANLGINYDVTPLIQKYKFDLSRIEPAYIANIQSIAPHGEMYAMPFYSYHNVLMYNKSIFDKFGVAYPKDGITWPEVYDLAKKLTQNVDGMQYRGLDPDGYGRLTGEYALKYVDPKTNQAVVANDPKWASVMSFLKNVYQIPGNLPDPSLIGSGRKSFTQDRNLAMWIGGTDLTQLIQTALETAGQDWDMASFPTWPDAPGQGEGPSSALLTINASSPYKDQAFQVIMYLLSDEVQTSLNRIGLATALKSDEIKKSFGADLPYFKGKNTLAPFVNKPTVKQQVSPYDMQGIATDPVKNALLQIVTDKQDVNTALLAANTQIDQNISKDKQQK